MNHLLILFFVFIVADANAEDDGKIEKGKMKSSSYRVLLAYSLLINIHISSNR